MTDKVSDNQQINGGSRENEIIEAVKSDACRGDEVGAGHICSLLVQLWSITRYCDNAGFLSGASDNVVTRVPESQSGQPVIDPMDPYLYLSCRWEIA